MQPTNLIVIMSDEHNPKVMGCNGHPLVKTPHIDARVKRRQAELLAENGGRDAVIKRGDLGFTPPPGYPIVLG